MTFTVIVAFEVEDNEQVPDAGTAQRYVEERLNGRVLWQNDSNDTGEAHDSIVTYVVVPLREMMDEAL